MKIWSCKVGEVEDVPDEADWPMRKAVEEAYIRLTGQEPRFIFSGWGAELTASERDVVENRPPRGRRALLGYATTKELIDELAARAQIAASNSDEWPSYVTVGGD